MTSTTRNQNARVIPDPRAGTEPSAPTAPTGLTPEQRRVRALARFATTITIFNIIGHLFLGFEQAPITPIVAALTSYAAAMLFEWLDAWAFGRRPEFTKGVREAVIFLLPAHITGLACAMLMWGNASLWPYLFAIVVGNGSKYVFRLKVNGKLRHFLNPSNTGIALSLVLFPWVGIAPPYHFTSFTSGALDWLIPLGILMFGSMLNAKLTGKMPLILGWLGAFVAQALLRWLLLDHALIGALLPMTGLAFILFTNYMITDPATSPTKTRNQVVYGATVAVVYSLLVLNEISFGLFFALVITCLLRGVVLFVVPRMRSRAGTA
ncbi:enediyne biosynthesis protein UnbU [Umezawaea sp. NPDC059074]|uniref:enediyne biosynthesis protein UnbU n=1 Tax=Umezawaea sp. NPDC059074 TaxID=3346716 RepID=UPI00368B4E73